MTEGIWEGFRPHKEECVSVSLKLQSRAAKHIHHHGIAMASPWHPFSPPVTAAPLWHSSQLTARLFYHEAKAHFPPSGLLPSVVMQHFSHLFQQPPCEHKHSVPICEQHGQSFMKWQTLPLGQLKLFNVIGVRPVWLWDPSVICHIHVFACWPYSFTSLALFLHSAVCMYAC